MQEGRRSNELPISPLAGEMSGRTEGGGRELTLSEISLLARRDHHHPHTLTSCSTRSFSPNMRK
ncbi:hypothetical protein CIT26_03090 [Mesorhizobium temperatum]|uniref:Propionyl-coenzyme A carboxylase alpha polypeptide n=1 Tax=Mesorhizobium temperatum TaxID=241416 RepID=A0A271LV66_9HYPH|nr:hypothetical protein CIT26_03090 [Mesorhizobium temperatum]